ncbi:hypothetical protein NQ317_004407 [Molorchus minor]|uniref:Uncharacterized protein n=1 Tax=Molorchus minor TaxID=1323400 RepID=A0ABQ9J600_9CUCU|nr:hypothetical protein NQ317_004407 [Molorchus minor]
MDPTVGLAFRPVLPSLSIILQVYTSLESRSCESKQKILPNNSPLSRVVLEECKTCINPLLHTKRDKF